MSTPGEHTTPGGAPTGTTAQEEQEWSWLFDFIQSFLRSPTWTTPLHNFIDDHCGQFSTDDENRLEYTTIHAQFVELVERLLSKNLKEIGVSEEQFVAAVASGASSDDALNRVIFGQILAVDDFLTFKKMMTQRNAELEVESMRTLATYSPSDEEEAQLQLELALALSQSEGDSGAAKKKKSDFSEDDLAAALRLSMLDVERHQSEYEREQAELEHAIAMSLAAEAERLRLREAAEEAEREAAAAAAKAAAEAKSTPVPPVVPATVAALPIVVGQPIAKAPVPPMTIKAPLAVPATIAVPSTAATAAATSSVAAPAKPVAGALPPIAASSLKLGSLPPLSVNKIGLGSFDLPLAAAQKAHESNVKHAEALFAKNQQVLRDSKSQSDAASSVSAAELARRKEFMQKQRELLLKKKKAEREDELEKYEAEKAELETSAAGSATLTEAEEVERRRAAMKGALVQHLKNVHNEVELKRLSTLERAEQASIQEQFAALETRRAAKEAAIADEREQRLAQEAERKRAMQELAENMAKNSL